MRYLAQANLTVDGQLVTYHTVLESDPSAEISDLVVAGLLIVEDADGKFPVPEPAPARLCCGGR